MSRASTSARKSRYASPTPTAAANPRANGDRVPESPSASDTTSRFRRSARRLLGLRCLRWFARTARRWRLDVCEQLGDFLVQLAQCGVRLDAPIVEASQLGPRLAQQILGRCASVDSYLLGARLGGGELRLGLARLLGAPQAQGDLEVLLGGAHALVDLGLQPRSLGCCLLVEPRSLARRFLVEAHTFGLRLDRELLFLGLGAGAFVLNLAGQLGTVMLDLGNALPERLVGLGVALRGVGDDLLGILARAGPDPLGRLVGGPPNGQDVGVGLRAHLGRVRRRGVEKLPDPGFEVVGGDF